MLFHPHLGGGTRMFVSMLGYAPGTFIVIGTIVLVGVLVVYALVYIFFMKK